MIFIVLLWTCSSQMILDYRFGRNFGKIFYDYSGSQNHGINGNNQISTQVKSTDRGIYLTKSSNFVEIPSSLKFPSQYSVVFWTLVEDSETLIFSRVFDSNQGYWALGRTINAYKILLNNCMSKCKKNEKMRDFPSGNKNSGEWIFFRLSYSQGQMKIYKNEALIISQNLEYPEICPCSTKIGSSSSISDLSLSGFIWRFSIFASLSLPDNYFLASSSTSCLVKGSTCSSCSFMIVDPDNGAGCLSVDLTPSINTFGIACKNSDFCYFNITLLSCDLKGYACVYNALERTCFSKDLKTGLEVQVACACHQNYLSFNLICYDSDCAVMDNSQFCLSCKDNNAEVKNGRCYCKDGFYGDLLIHFNGKCKPCMSQCKTCSNPSSCQTCKDPNAEFSSSQCLCKQVYYLPPDNSICQPCSSLCKTCTSAETCTTCLSPNIHLSSGTCICDNGFFAISSTSCQACNSGCSICSSKTICSSCKDQLALLSPTEPGTCDCPTNSTWDLLFEKCLNCGAGCEKCDFSLTCLKCFDPNAELLENGKCSCKEGFFDLDGNCFKCLVECKSCINGESCESCQDFHSFGSDCEKCHEKCWTCDGSEESNCLSCNDSRLLNGFCLKMCPLGFEEKDESCEMENPMKIFWVTFESFGKYFDVVNNFSLNVVSHTNSRNLIDSGIKSSYKRGIYCKGTGYLEMKVKDVLFLFQSFAFSVWVNPYNESGVIFSRYSQTNSSSSQIIELQSLSFKSLLPYFQVGVMGVKSEIKSEQKLVLKSWNHLFVSLVLSNLSSVQLRVNTLEDQILTLESHYQEADQSLLLITNDLSFNFPYKGFIYSFEIYSTNTDFISILSGLTSNDCSTCQICPNRQECIPSCSFQEFYDEDSDSCKICLKNCESGCKGSNVCNTCADNFCVSCFGLGEKSCFKCSHGYQVLEGQCQLCTIEQFFDEENEKCFSCQGLCFSCKNEQDCIECKANSSKKGSEICYCDLGFENINDNCIQVNFSASFWISRDFEIHLDFEENLIPQLTSSDITVEIEDSSVDFSLERIDSSSYIIYPSYTVHGEITVEITLQKKIYSEKHHFLNITHFIKTIEKSSLNEFPSSITSKVQLSEQSAKSSLAASAAASVSISILTMDPSSIFDFMNTAEIFYSVYLFNLELNPILEEFLLKYRLQNYIPNAFVYILDERKGKRLSKKLRKFGYPSNLAIVNLGPQLQTLIFCLILWGLVEIASLFTCCKKRLEKTRSNFKFNVFLRIWIQTFFECLIACFFSLKFNELENKTQVVDFSLTVFFTTFQFLMIVIFLFLVRKRNFIESGQNNAFLERFGELFHNFKIGSSFQLFYIFFFCRRVLLVVCYAFVEDGVFQMATSVSFSVIIPFYLAIKRAFSDINSNIYHIANESVIFIFHCVVLSSFIYDDRQSDNFATAAYGLILIAAGLNIAFRGFLAVKQTIEKVRTCLRKRNSKIYQINEVSLTTNKASIVSDSGEIKQTKIAFE